MIAIPACHHSFLGQDLRTSMKVLCLAVVPLSMFPGLLGLICYNNSDPTRFSPLVSLVLALVVFFMLFVPDIPPVLYFLVNILWCAVTLFVCVNYAVHIVYDIQNTLPGTPCRISAVLVTVGWGYIMLIMCLGTTLYWSFYVERT